MIRSEAYVLVAAGKPFERRTMELDLASDEDVIVEVTACSLCHTDLGFASGGVAPKKGLPIVLGHEIVGKVVAARGELERLVGHRVLVPAVMPCGKCAYCAAGRGNACPKQKMPGNDIDGGFATHVIVPGNSLVPLDEVPAQFDWRELSVVADAVSTAYQAIRRAALAKGDLAIVVGSGGVGGYAIQIARALGARVVACDVSAERLAMVKDFGAERTIDVKGRPPKDVRKDVQAIAKEWNVPSLSHRIFECSGTTDGQLLAYTLIGPASTMVQTGYTPKPVEVRLSNLMAFDATVHGTWGCPPSAYGDVLRLIYDRKVVITPFITHSPMSRIDAVMDDMANHRLTQRVIFDPRT
ncbi:MAG TPA: 6-hydroxycyclohex-1-ene-1-carbonyl-CoA dehydrogenase [Polyangiaceae bacterium]|nr:6-hydroxycyclohex-1-ene-1-carbonyl-CoA dehydrogenase [Polyangiaceae bacterium]